jgi:putative DNA primase/helicase
MTAELPMFTVWYATGNNLRLRGDVLRRVIPCRLEPGEERPEERRDFTIEGDLLAHVRRERPRLVAAALTLLKAHALAGRPRGDLAPLGSFEGWSDVVRAAVWWATDIDPCGPRAELRDDDPDSIARKALVHGWAELPDAAEGVTVAEALKHLDDNPTRFEQLYNTLLERSRNDFLPSRNSIGMYLRANKGRVVEGLVLESINAGKNTKAWRVRPASRGTSGTSGTIFQATRVRERQRE